MHTYVRGCMCTGQHLKQTSIWGTITQRQLVSVGTAASFVVKMSSSETVAKFAMPYGLPCQNNEWPLNNTLGYECQSNPANIATNVFGKYLNDLVLAHPQSGSFTIPRSPVELEFGNLGFEAWKTPRKKLPVFS